MEVAEDEYQKFNKAVGLGLKEIGAYKEITAEDAFYFYETFGLPYELVKELKPEAAKNLFFDDFKKNLKNIRRFPAPAWRKNSAATAFCLIRAN